MNQTWTRAMLKENAKRLFRKNYWLCVGVAFILTVLGGSGMSSVGSSGVNVVTQQVQSDNDYYDDYDDYYDDDYGYYEDDYYEDDYYEDDYYEDSHEDSVADNIFLSIFLIIIIVLFIVILLIDILVFNVIEVGGKMFFIQNRSMTPPAGCIFDGFKKDRYSNIMKTMFFKDLYVFLWSLLLLVPGIVKAYEYLMVPYILAENPTMDRKDAFALSKRMMTGQKWDAFVLDLSFYGWFLLSAITCGLVGIFYVTPYYMATITELYAFNKIKAYNEGYIR